MTDEGSETKSQEIICGNDASTAEHCSLSIWALSSDYWAAEHCSLSCWAVEHWTGVPVALICSQCLLLTSVGTVIEQSPQIWAKPPHLSFCVNHSFENVGLNAAASSHPLLCNLFCLWMVIAWQHCICICICKMKTSLELRGNREGQVGGNHTGRAAPPFHNGSSHHSYLPLFAISLWAFNLRIFMIHRRSSKHWQKLVFKSCEGLVEETTLLPYLTLCNIGRYRPHIFSQNGGRCRPNLVKV